MMRFRIARITEVAVAVGLVVLFYIVSNENIPSSRNSSRDVELPEEQLLGELQREEWNKENGKKMVSLSKYNSRRNDVDTTKMSVSPLIRPVRPRVLQNDFIHLSVVACGNRFKEAMVMLKSAVLQAVKPLHFHIFAGAGLQSWFKQELERWPSQFRQKVVFHIYPIIVPGGRNSQEWRKLFKPCASQRLFLPDIDAVLYVDTDVLFLRPIDDVWAHFKKFNSSQIAALAADNDDPDSSFYNRFARHPYYGPLGLNSGVFLMNLTRLREVNFVKKIVAYYEIYKNKLFYGDQDLINIYFHDFPETLYVFRCDWNFRSDHCRRPCTYVQCNGASVLHGGRQVFHEDEEPAFKAIYKVFNEFKMGNNLQELVMRMKQVLKETSQTQCGKVAHIFTDQLEKQIKADADS